MTKEEKIQELKKDFVSHPRQGTGFASWWKNNRAPTP